MKSLPKTVGLILLGGMLGYFAHWPRPASRFVWDKDSSYVLDTKTGQLCIPVENGRGQGVPVCLDVYKHY